MGKSSLKKYEFNTFNAIKDGNLPAPIQVSFVLKQSLGNIAYKPSICSMMKVESFVFNEFQENTYVVYDETGQCVVIDPGCYHPKEQQQLAQFIEKEKLTPVKLLNTHCHIDHVLGNEFVVERYQVSLHMHADEVTTYHDTARWTALFGIPPLLIPESTVWLTEKDTIRFGNSELAIAFTPGHSIASLTFYSLSQRIAIVGDVLFEGSIGRTDLPGGNFNQLIDSIRKQILVWPDDMVILPGHGNPTTVGVERKYNPYLKTN